VSRVPPRARNDSSRFWRLDASAWVSAALGTDDDVVELRQLGAELRHGRQLLRVCVLLQREGVQITLEAANRAHERFGVDASVCRSVSTLANLFAQPADTPMVLVGWLAR